MRPVPGANCHEHGKSAPEKSTMYDHLSIFMRRDAQEAHDACRKIAITLIFRLVSNAWNRKQPKFECNGLFSLLTKPRSGS
jgi:hypothetical protein